MSALSPAPHSSWIAFHGYSGGIMTLITKSGESYAAKIPETRYTDFLKAPSQGSFFNLYIKPYSTVTKVDAAQDVAVVERAKEAITAAGVLVKDIDAVTAHFEAKASPSTVTVPKPARKSPAKSLLPTKPWTGGYAWVDFRCLNDPTTGAAVKAGVRTFLSGRDSGGKIPDSFLPIGTPDAMGYIRILALGNREIGPVNPKYLKSFNADGVGYVALAKAYRAAYKSWLRRNAARAATAKTKVAATPITASLDRAKAPVVSKPAVQVVAVPVGVDQARVNMALGMLRAMEEGSFYLNSTRYATTLHAGGWSFRQKRG